MNLETRIYNYALAAGLNPVVAKLFVAQIKHETGNFKSRAFKIDNNPGGYKYVGQKGASQGIQSSEGDFYAHFQTLQDGVNAMIGWLKRRQSEHKFIINDLTTPYLYASALKKAGYYGDTLVNYANGLQRQLKELINSNAIKQTSGILGIALIGMAAYLFMIKK